MGTVFDNSNIIAGFAGPGQNAQLQQQQVDANKQRQMIQAYAFQQAQKQDSLDPQIAAARLSAISPDVAMAPPSGQASTPMNVPMPGAQFVNSPAQNGPVSSIPGTQAQSSSPSSGGGMYTVQQMADKIKQRIPGASPQVVMGAIDANYKLLNDTGKQQLELLKLQIAQQGLGIRAQNADTNSQRAGIAGANAAGRISTNLGQGTPASSAAMAYMPPPRSGMSIRGGISPTPPMPRQAPPLPRAVANAAASMPGAQLNASDLGAPEGMLPSMNSGSFPSASVKQANTGAQQQGKDNEAWFSTQRPTIIHALDSVEQAKQAASRSDLFATGGIAPEARAYFAGAVAQLTGDPEATQTAIEAQLQSKSFADVLNQTIQATGGTSGQRFTDFARKLQQQAKADPSKRSEVNVSILNGFQGYLQERQLQGDYKAEYSQRTGRAFDRAGQLNMDAAAKKYPLFSYDKTGAYTYNAGNAEKQEKMLFGKSSSSEQAPDSDDPNRPLTAEELAEYRQLGGK